MSLYDFATILIFAAHCFRGFDLRKSYFRALLRLIQCFLLSAFANSQWKLGNYRAGPRIYRALWWRGQAARYVPMKQAF
jgi:hypothetical protein